MELLLLVFFCLLTGSEVTFGAEKTFITVDEGRDVTLPCSLREDITNKKFEWKKDDQKQVFLYDDEDHSNNINTGQDQQFKGRVSYFPDKLKSGNASITISNIKVFDSGVYTCEFPDLQRSQIFYIQLDVVNRNILDRDIEEPTVTVKEGRDVILPCSLREDITNKKFVWKKDGRQVFLYDDGDHSNIIRSTTQDQQFKGRVEHLPDKLKSGDASIIIRDTKVFDSGEYTCNFTDLQPRQIFYMKLIVFVEAPQLSLRILNQTQRAALLQCEVQGAFPKPELHWQDSDGNKLPGEKPQESERGRLFYIILQTTVTKTDNYRCVATQEETNHQAHADIPVHITGLTAGETAGIVIVPLLVVGFVVAVVVVGVLAVLISMGYITMKFNKGASPKPSVKIVEQTDKSALLQGEVRGAFPKPKLHRKDRAGNKLPAPKPQESERGGLYDIILNTNVYRTVRYRCVAEQKETNHQAHADIPVDITDEGDVDGTSSPLMPLNGNQPTNENS